MNKPIFCIVGESGVGKSTYLELIINSNLSANKIAELKYCTTRKKRYPDEDSYYFVTNDKFLEEQEKGNIIESRHYEKYDEDVEYFTTYDNINIEDCDALICAASVNQALSYMEKLNDVYIIDIKVDLKERIKRLLNRANTNDEVLEICRRTVEEQEEYSKINTIDHDIIHIYNDNSKFKFSNTGNMLYSLITTANLNTIEKYIDSKIKK
jgi:guanylate kinase